LRGLGKRQLPQPMTMHPGNARPDHVDLCLSDDRQLAFFRSGGSQLRKPEVYEEIIVVLLSQASTVPMTTSEQTLVTTVKTGCMFRGPQGHASPASPHGVRDQVPVIYHTHGFNASFINRSNVEARSVRLETRFIRLGTGGGISDAIAY